MVLYYMHFTLVDSLYFGEFASCREPDAVYLTYCNAVFYSVIRTGKRVTPFNFTVLYHLYFEAFSRLFLKKALCLVLEESTAFSRLFLKKALLVG